MRTPKNPEERARKHSPPIIAFTVLALTLEILAVLLLDADWYTAETFSVWIAPPIEEAVKGGFASLLAAIYLILRARGKLGGSDPLKWAVLAGVLSGVAFALSESLGQGESLLAVGTGLYTHSIWTVGVSVGCWGLILGGEKRFLAGVFPVAVAGHVSWNHFVQNPGVSTGLLAGLLLGAVLVGVFWWSLRGWGKGVY